MPSLLDQLRHLPRNTIVYHTAITLDAAGNHFIDATQSVPLVANAANAPVFAVDDVDVGKGTVGGDVLSWAAAGQTAAAMAVRVLNGEKTQDIPVVKSNSSYLFDWRAMQRWRLKESDLPYGSIVLNRQPTFWDSFKWYLIGGGIVISLEGALILALLWLRARQKKLEDQLVVTGERLRMADYRASVMAYDVSL
jgi:hypothetical protein